METIAQQLAEGKTVYGVLGNGATDGAVWYRQMQPSEYESVDPVYLMDLVSGVTPVVYGKQGEESIWGVAGYLHEGTPQAKNLTSDNQSLVFINMNDEDLVVNNHALGVKTEQSVESLLYKTIKRELPSRLTLTRELNDEDLYEQGDTLAYMKGTATLEQILNDKMTLAVEQGCAKPLITAFDHLKAGKQADFRKGSQIISCQLYGETNEQRELRYGNLDVIGEDQGFYDPKTDRLYIKNDMSGLHDYSDPHIVRYATVERVLGRPITSPQDIRQTIENLINPAEAAAVFSQNAAPSKEAALVSDANGLKQYFNDNCIMFLNSSYRAAPPVPNFVADNGDAGGNRAALDSKLVKNGVTIDTVSAMYTPNANATAQLVETTTYAKKPSFIDRFVNKVEPKSEEIAISAKTEMYSNGTMQDTYLLSVKQPNGSFKPLDNKQYATLELARLTARQYAADELIAKREKEQPSQNSPQHKREKSKSNDVLSR